MSSVFSHRYDRNFDALSQEDMKRLMSSRVCVIGCGGLGGYVIEYLGRLGVGHITAVDGDVFNESNLNRQLYSAEAFLGRPKAEAARLRMLDVNSEIFLRAVCEYFTEDNAEDILSDCDLVIDALDNLSSRMLLERAAERQGITVIHGAISGWTGQISVCRPGERVLSEIYGENIEDRGDEQEAGNLSFTAGVVAGIEAAEAVKVLTGRTDEQGNMLLAVDLLEGEYDTVEL